ncbi:MAG TPA: AAA family ATPase [Streptosporangiaceae bacterium]|nr:AAA family ATPase [Streptosporangiaceae bacterium]
MTAALRRDEAPRQDEARILRALLDEAIRGEGHIAVVSGAAGMGKSGLLAALADQAASCDAVSLVACCSPAEAELPFAVMGQLLQGAPLTAADRDRAPDRLDEDVRNSLAPAASSVAQSLCDVVLGLAGRRPVLLAVDDVQFADEASLRCLSHIVRRIRRSRVLAVFSQQEVAWRAPGDFQAELLRQPRCQYLRLAPLGGTDVAQIAAAALGQDVAARIAPRWLALSGGNPLLVHALVADYPEPGEAYGRAVLSCLSCADPVLSQIAAGLAVLGGGDDLGRVVRLDAEVLGPGLDALCAAGVVGPDHRFRHPRARSAILASLHADLRGELHERAAQAAFGSGADAELVAGHLRSAARGAGPWAVPVLQEAARSALDDGRIAAAVDYLKLAQDACPDDQHRAAIKTTLVRAEWRINPGVPSSHLTELIGELGQGHLGGADMVVLAKALLWHGRIDDAEDVLRQLGSLRTDEGESAAAQTAAELSAVRPWLRCTYPPVVELLPAAPSASLVPPAATVLHRQEAATALVAVLTEGRSDGLLPGLERILRYSRLDDMSMDAVECALLAMTFGAHLDDAARWSEVFFEEAVTRRAPSREARLAAILAEIAFRRGDLPEARRYGELALRLIPFSGWGVAAGAPVSVLVLALTAMGRLEDAAELVRRPVAQEMLRTRYGLQYLYARGQHQLAAGNAPAAAADFKVVGGLMRTWALDCPGLVNWRLAAAEALLRVGQRRQARELVDEQLSKAASLSGREHGATKRLAALTGEIGNRSLLLRQAADLLQDSGDRYELARALASLAAAYHKSGESRRARTVRTQALALAQECQAEPLVRKLSAESEPAERSEPGTLSETERRVADLAAIGYTNRDISDKLFITVSTVEQHLTRIYRKLNLRGRGDLARAHCSPLAGQSR